MLTFQRALPVFSLLLAHVCSAEAADDTFFYKSHDLSSLKMLDDGGGTKFFDTAKNNISRPLEDILRDGGMNTVKLRLFVEPTADGTGRYGLNYTLALAKRFVVKEKFKFILNMHLSDDWCDPGKQHIPSTWPSDPTALAATVQKYVSDTLSTFCSAGATPNIITLGNEISRGMLWDVGRFEPYEEPFESRVNTFKAFARLWKAARNGVDDAVKTGTCKTRPDVAMHLDAGWDTTLYYNIYSALFKTGIVEPTDLDVFGLTNYPYFGTEGTFANVKRTSEMLVGNWSRKIHILETDYHVKCSIDLAESQIPLSPAGQIQWVGNLTAVMKGLPDGKGQGVSYWEGAWLNFSSLGNGGCDDGLLFDQAYSSTEPSYLGYSRESVNIFRD